MTNVLLLIVIGLATVNLIAVILKKTGVESGVRFEEVDKSIVRFEAALERFEKTIRDEFQRSREESGIAAAAGREELAKALASFKNQFAGSIDKSNEMLRRKFDDFGLRQKEINNLTIESIRMVESTIDKNLKSIRDDNTRQLNEMRRTVDEKLQSTLEKRLGESFRQVSERLEQVHKGLGEMRNIANGVGDLKKVLSNVKTRGTLGEYQLGNILEQMLAPSQYACNVATKKGSQANVEFAIRLPGRNSDSEVWMPIDSKFPIEGYQALLDAIEAGDRDSITECRKQLTRSIEQFAGSISEKYIDPPHTTDFAIMFLPAEGLYAEVLRDTGLFETLQRKHRITVTGPTTLSALLNSLQMGFRTLAVQKRSSEVWNILKSVKSEFDKFSETLGKVRKQLNTATNTLDSLQTTRTNVLVRKLKDVETLDVADSTDKTLAIAAEDKIRMEAE